MTDNLDDDCDVIRGSGNVFRDFGHLDAGREQLRAILAAKIIGVLDDRKLTVREAQTLTGVAGADFSRIRRVNLARFTIDRLMTILSRLGQEVEISVEIHPRRQIGAGVAGSASLTGKCDAVGLKGRQPVVRMPTGTRHETRSLS